MALVSGISLDPEAAICVTKRLPPKWIDGVEEVSLYAHNIYDFKCSFWGGSAIKFSSCN